MRQHLFRVLHDLVSGENETLPTEVWTIPNLSTLKSILPDFTSLNGLADFHRNRTGLGVRHQAAGTQNTAQRTDLTHYVRRTDDHIDVGPAGL